MLTSKVKAFSLLMICGWLEISRSGSIYTLEVGTGRRRGAVPQPAVTRRAEVPCSGPRPLPVLSAAVVSLLRVRAVRPLPGSGGSRWCSVTCEPRTPTAAASLSGAHERSRQVSLGLRLADSPPPPPPLCLLLVSFHFETTDHRTSRSAGVACSVGPLVTHILVLLPLRLLVSCDIPSVCAETPVRGGLLAGAHSHSVRVSSVPLMALRWEPSVRDGAISVPCPGLQIPVNISIKVARWCSCPCVQNGPIPPVVSSICDCCRPSGVGSRTCRAAPARCPTRADASSKPWQVWLCGPLLIQAILIQASGPSATCGFSCLLRPLAGTCTTAGPHCPYIGSLSQGSPRQLLSPH